MDIKRKRLAAAAAGLLAVGGLGAGVAVAGSNGPSQPATVRIQPASAAQTPTSTPAGTGSQSGPTAQTSEPSGPDRDNIQEGDQNAPDDANEANEPNEANEANEKEGTEQEGSEKEGTEEPGDENLPGGGHADPQGQNVDHQSQGVE